MWHMHINIYTHIHICISIYTLIHTSFRAQPHMIPSPASEIPWNFTSFQPIRGVSESWASYSPLGLVEDQLPFRQNLAPTWVKLSNDLDPKGGGWTKKQPLKHLTNFISQNWRLNNHFRYEYGNTMQMHICQSFRKMHAEFFWGAWFFFDL